MIRLLLLLALPALLSAQTRDTTARTAADSMIQRARKLGMEGREGDGRRLLDSLLIITTPDSPIYAEALYARAALATTAVDAERVYAVFSSTEQFLVKAFDHEGKELWSANLGGFRSQHGHGASPILWDGKLIVSNDQDGESFVVALDAKTGRQVWKSPRRSTDRGAAYGTPCLLERPGAPPELLLTSQSYGISSIDPKTGRPNWEAKVFDKRAVSSPVIADNLINIARVMASPASR